MGCDELKYINSLIIQDILTSFGMKTRCSAVRAQLVKSRSHGLNGVPTHGQMAAES